MAVINVTSNYHYQTRIYGHITHIFRQDSVRQKEENDTTFCLRKIGFGEKLLTYGLNPKYYNQSQNKLPKFHFLWQQYLGLLN